MANDKKWDDETRYDNPMVAEPDHPKTQAPPAGPQIMDPNVEPPGYKPPTSAKELQERYAKGERYFLGANLRIAKAYRVYLREACLRGANLQRATFRHANLTKSDLTKANLQGVDLRRSNLRGANLEAANLRGANLRGANLTKANLTKANLAGATLDGADLRFCLQRGLLVEDTVVAGATMDLAAYKRSRLSPQELGLLLQRGIVVRDLKAFPKAVLGRLFGDSERLTLYFNTRLTFANEAIVRAVLAAALDGKECSCTLEPTPNGVLVRLSGLSNEDLLVAADRLSDFFATRPDALIEAAIERGISRTLPPAVASSVHESIQATVPAVIHESMTPLLLAHAQLGEKIVERVETIFGEVLRTEIQLSGEVVDALNKLRDEVLEEKLGKMEFRYDRKLGKLVREGAWAVGTSAAGSGLYAVVMKLLKMAGG